MEKSHICKIKSQCLFDERICRLCRPLFKYSVLAKKSEAANPLVKGIGAEQKACFPPHFKAVSLFQKEFDRWCVHGCWEEHGLLYTTSTYPFDSEAKNILVTPGFWHCVAQVSGWRSFSLLPRCSRATLSLWVCVWLTGSAGAAATKWPSRGRR